MPVLKALAAALPAIFLVASPAMAQEPLACEAAPVAEAPAVEDASAETTAATPAGEDPGGESTINPDFAATTAEGLMFSEQLGAIPAADCEAAPTATTTPVPTLPSPDIADAVSDLAELLSVF